MGLNFGTIEYVEVFGDEVRITGHKWAALAFGYHGIKDPSVL